MKDFSIYISNPEFGRFGKDAKNILLSQNWRLAFNDKGRLLTPDELALAASDFDCLIPATENLHSLISQSTRLKFIAKMGVGLDNIPLNLCMSKGIKVSYTPDAVTHAAAELAMTFILALLRQVFPAHNLMKQGGWSRIIGHEIAEVKIGILGWGRIGKHLTRLLLPFNPKEIIINDLVDYSAEIKEFAAKSASKTLIKQVSFEELLKESDLLTLHCDLNELSRGIINAQSLSLMKNTAYLINTARGALIDESALVNQLRSKKIAGAAIDVFSHEPYTGELTKEQSVISSCHMGSLTLKARLAMERDVVNSVIAYSQGEPIPNQVPAKEYEK